MSGVQSLAEAMADVSAWHEDDAPSALPDSWTDVRHESLQPGHRRFYAVAARVGEYRTIVHAERAVRVLYVRADGRRAFDRRYGAVTRSSGTLPDPETFASTLSLPPHYGGALDEDERAEFVALLGELYGIEVEDGGEGGE